MSLQAVSCNATFLLSIHYFANEYSYESRDDIAVAQLENDHDREDRDAQTTGIEIWKGPTLARKVKVAETTDGLFDCDLDLALVFDSDS